MTDTFVERHRVLISDRGGARRIADLVDVAEVNWNRKLDAKSEASVTISGRACRQQADILRSIEPRRHELVLYRGSERVWEGPIVQTQAIGDTFAVTAQDVVEYLDHRPLTRKWGNSEDSGDPGEPIMTERIREILTYELDTNYVIATNTGNVTVPAWESLSPPANVLPYLDIRLGTTLTRAVTEAFEMTVGEHLRALARSIGVNFTVIGRRIVVWDGDLAQLRTVTEADFTNGFKFVKSGTDFYNVAHVVSTSVNEGTEPVVGHAATDLSYYGPWSAVVSTDSEDVTETTPDIDALRTQARRALAGRYPVPADLIVGEGGSLILSPGLSLNLLVPGTIVPVRANLTIARVAQDERIESVNVKETAGGEFISATFSSVTAVEES